MGITYNGTPSENIQLAKNRISNNNSALSQYLQSRKVSQLNDLYVAKRKEEQAELEEKNEASVGEKIGDTLGDIFKNIASGVEKAFEGLIDFGASTAGIIGGWAGDNEFKQKMADFTARDLTEEGWDNLRQQGLDVDFNNSAIYDLSEKGQEIVRGVSQGVGQMLPTVLLALATGGASAGASATSAGASASASIASATAKTAQMANKISKIGKAVNTGLFVTSAVGTGVESALNDVDENGNVVSLDRAYLYGLAEGAKEWATERLVGGAIWDKGSGVLDKAIGNISKNARFNKLVTFGLNSMGEGVEELVGEAFENTLQTIYKDSDGKIHWEDPDVESMIENGVVGALTSAVLGVGQKGLTKLSPSLTVKEELSNLADNEQYAQNMQDKGNYDEKVEARVTSEREKSIESIGKRLVNMTEEKRKQQFISSPQLTNYFNTDGTVKTTKLNEGVQELNVKEAVAQGTVDSRIVDRNKISNDIAQAQKDLSKYDSNAKVTIETNLDTTQKETQTKIKTLLNKVGTSTGKSLKLVVYNAEDVNGADGTKRMGAFVNGDVVYVNSKNLSNTNEAVASIVHETIHFSEDTEAHKALINLFKDKFPEIYNNVSNYVKNEAIYRTSTNQEELWEKEIDAHLVEKIIEGSNGIIERLVRDDSTMAKRVFNKVKDTIKYIEAVFKKDANKINEYKSLKICEKIFNRVFAVGGTKELEKAINGDKSTLINNSSIGIDVNDGVPQMSVKAIQTDILKYEEMLRNVGDEDYANGIINTVNIVCDKIQIEIDKVLANTKYSEEKKQAFINSIDYAHNITDEELAEDTRQFKPVKNNSDKLYKVSLDFSTLCKKRLLQQIIEILLAEKLNKNITRAESIQIREELQKLRDEGERLQIQVACGLCYVESARAKGASIINKFLNERQQYLTEFINGENEIVKEDIREAETNARKKLKVWDDNLAFNKQPPLKTLTKSQQDEIRKAKKEVLRQGGYLTADDKAEIEYALSLPASDFVSPIKLEELKRNHPKVYQTFKLCVSSATKSKAIENDTYYRAGDTQEKMTDSLIGEMNAENGTRSQSWSDFQVSHLLDYMGAIIELSYRKSKMQAYTKVADFVKLLGKTGVMINLSLIPTPTFNGKLEFSPVEGMDYQEALDLRESYPQTTGTIAIGTNDEQIKMLLASEFIDYVIPYHASGMPKALYKKYQIDGWKSYQAYQQEKAYTEKELKDAGLEKAGKETKFSDWFKEEKVKQLEAKGLSGVQIMQELSKDYLAVCKERGLHPKFENFVNEENYWKLLIDRKMINHKTGKIIIQEAVKPEFDLESINEIIDNHVKGFDKVYEDEQKAIKTIVEKFKNKELGDKDTKKLIDMSIDEFEINSMAFASENAVAYKEQVKEDAKKIKEEYSDNGYSFTNVDSDGNKLSKEQIDFFKDSKMRDKEGNLLMLYHATNSGGFSIFQNDFGDYYFTDSMDNALTYTNNGEYVPTIQSIDLPRLSTIENIKTISDLEEYINSGEYAKLNKDTAKYKLLKPNDAETSKVIKNYIDKRVEALKEMNAPEKLIENEKNKALGQYYVIASSIGKYTFVDEIFNKNEFKDVIDSLLNLAESEHTDVYENSEESGVYECYLNAKNPLVVDCFGSKFNDIYFNGKRQTTDEISKYAKSKGHDGVIFKNIYDYGINSDERVMSNTYAVFNQNQIKAINNTNPSSDNDIRYSVKSLDVDLMDKAFYDNMLSLDDFLDYINSESYKRKEQFNEYNREKLYRELELDKKNWRTKEQTRQDYFEKLFKSDLLEKFVNKLVNENPKMKEFFKDSKVRNKDGSLKVMFHATPYEFNEFSTNKLTELRDKGTTSYYGLGFYFSDDTRVKEIYGKNIKTVLLNITNPMEMNQNKIPESQYRELANEIFNKNDYKFKHKYHTIEDAINDTQHTDYYALDKWFQYTDMSYEDFYGLVVKITGYDGIEVPHKGWYVAFLPNQIKSVLNFAPTNTSNDIRYSVKNVTEKSILSNDELTDAQKIKDLSKLYKDKIATLNKEIDSLNKQLEKLDKNNKEEIAKLNNIIMRKQSRIEMYQDRVLATRKTVSLQKLIKKFESENKGKIFAEDTLIGGEGFQNVLDDLAKYTKFDKIGSIGTRTAIAKLKEWYNKNNEKLSGGIDTGDGTKLFFDEEIADLIDGFEERAKDPDYKRRRLTADEIDAFKQIVSKLHYISKYYNYIKSGEEYKKIKDYTDKSYTTMDKMKGMTKHNPLFTSLKKYLDWISEPRVVLKSLFGYQENGLSDLYEDIANGEAHAGAIKMEMLQKLEEFYKEHKNYKKSLGKVVEFNGKKITKAELLTLYKYEKQEHSRTALYETGFGMYDKKTKLWKEYGTLTPVDEPIYLDKKGNVVPFDPDNKNLKKVYVWNNKSSIDDLLTKEDRDYLKTVEDVMKIGAKYQIETDYEYKYFTNIDEENTEYYMPIKRYQGDRAKTIEESFYDSMSSSAVGNQSINKNRIANKKRIDIKPIDELVSTYAKQVGQYAGLAVPIREFQKVLNFNLGSDFNHPKTLRNLLGEEISSNASKYIKQLIEDISGIGKSNSVGFLGKLRGNYAKFQLAFNPKVIISQTASYPTAFTELSTSSMFKAFLHKINGAEMDAYSELARVRNYENGVTRSEGLIDKLSKATDILTKPINIADRLTIDMLYNASKVEVEKRHKGDANFKYGTEENKKEASKLLDKIIRTTQPNYTTAERTQLQRTQNEFLKTFAMFTSVPSKQISRLIESFGEARALQYKQHKLGETLTKGEKRKVKTNLAKTITAVTIANVVYVMMGQLIKHIFDKDKEKNGEEITFAQDFGFDLLSTTVGLLPVAKELYAFFVDGFEFDSGTYLTGGLEDIISTTKDIVELISSLAEGNMVESYQWNQAMKTLANGIGQILGIPTRNIYNTIYGLVKRFNPEEAYKWNSLFYSSARYTTDLRSAIDNGDNDLALTIIGLIMDDNSMMSSSNVVNEKIKELYEAGYSVLPKTIKDTVSYEGETYELSANQQKKVESIYGDANKDVETLIKSKSFSALDGKVQAKAIKWIYDYYYENAICQTLGLTANSKKLLFAETMSISKFALAISSCGSLEADKDKEGNAISGSKKTKVLSLLNKLTLTKAEKQMILAYLGYSVDEDAISKYIGSIGLTKKQQSIFMSYIG